MGEDTHISLVCSSPKTSKMITLDGLLRGFFVMQRCFAGISTEKPLITFQAHAKFHILVTLNLPYLYMYGDISFNFKPFIHVHSFISYLSSSLHFQWKNMFRLVVLPCSDLCRSNSFHALYPSSILPSVPPPASNLCLQVFSPVCILECVLGLFKAGASGADMCYHDCLTVTTQSIFQEASQFAISVINVVISSSSSSTSSSFTSSLAAQSVDAVSQGQEGAVDVSTFLHAQAAILRWREEGRRDKKVFTISL